MPFRHASDQVRAARQRQGAGKAANDGHHLTFQPKRFQGIINRPSFQTAPRNADVGTSVANVALPTLSHSFNASFQQVQCEIERGVAILIPAEDVFAEVRRITQ